MFCLHQLRFRGRAEPGDSLGALNLLTDTSWIWETRVVTLQWENWRPRTENGKQFVLWFCKVRHQPRRASSPTKAEDSNNSHGCLNIQSFTSPRSYLFPLSLTFVVFFLLPQKLYMGSYCHIWRSLGNLGTFYCKFLVWFGAVYLDYQSWGCIQPSRAWTGESVAGC